jgi:hypothetical protein
MGDLWFCEMESSKKVVVYSASGWTTPLGSWIAVKIAQLWGGTRFRCDEVATAFPTPKAGNGTAEFDHASSGNYSLYLLEHRPATRNQFPLLLVRKTKSLPKATSAVASECLSRAFGS